MSQRNPVKKTCLVIFTNLGHLNIKKASIWIIKTATEMWLYTPQEKLQSKILDRKKETHWINVRTTLKKKKEKA